LTTVDECSQFETKFFDWAEQMANYGRKPTVDFKYVSNQPDGLVGYSEGTLQFTPGKIIGGNGVVFFTPDSFDAVVSMPAYPQDRQGNSIQGVQQYFNAERNEDWSQGGSLPTHSYPFNPTRVDDLGLSIARDSPVLGGKLHVTLTLHTWGDGKLSFEPTCAGGILYGILEGTQTSVLISLQNPQAPKLT
jgi:hypothetical protein